MNTVDLEHGREWLGSADAVKAWFAEAGFGVEDSPADTDVRRAVELREALRALMVGNSGGAPDEAAIATVNHFARAGGVTVRLEPDGGVRLVSPEQGFDGALCGLLVIVFTAMFDGSWRRLKSCPRCRWVFYDYSKNRSASWCSMQLCGNKVKTRAFRARRQDVRQT